MTHCPVCGAADWKDGGHAFRHGSPDAHAIRRCAVCGLRGVAHPESAIENDERYAGDYYAQSEADPSWRLRAKAWFERTDDPLLAGVRRRLFTAWLPRPVHPHARMLDIGCGAGQLLDRASALGWLTEGCELSAMTGRAAREKGYVVHTGGWHRSLPASRYDLVVMGNVLEHLLDPHPALQAVANTLRPGGVALVTLPNFGCTQAAVFGGTWWALLPPEHVWYYHLDHLTNVLRAAGLRVTGVRTRPLIIGLLEPSYLRLQWLSWRERGGSRVGFWRRVALSFSARDGGATRGAVARSPLYTLECARADDT